MRERVPTSYGLRSSSRLRTSARKPCAKAATYISCIAAAGRTSKESRGGRAGEEEVEDVDEVEVDKEADKEEK